MSQKPKFAFGEDDGQVKQMAEAVARDFPKHKGRGVPASTAAPKTSGAKSGAVTQLNVRMSVELVNQAKRIAFEQEMSGGELSTLKAVVSHLFEIGLQEYKDRQNGAQNDAPQS